MMDHQQHENPMCTISDEDLNDTFSFSFSFDSMVIHDQEEAKDREQDQYQDSDFEFMCTTPDSPSSDPDKDSPADHLFFNGRLQPHTFPFQSFKESRIIFSRCTSQTSSISSKDSFGWSRSNSTNSSNSRSSCSSARTSSSEYRDKKPMKSDNGEARMKGLQNSFAKPGRLQQSASTKRWQYITPAPVLLSAVELPRRKSNEAAVKNESRSKKQPVKSSWSSWFIIRLLRSFLTACRECHALESSEKQDGLGQDIEMRVS